MILLVGGIALLGPALLAWSSIVQVPAAGLVATLGCGAALVIVVCAAIARHERSLHRLDAVVLGAAIVILVAWAVTELYFQPAYGTDEAAFVQYSSQLILHGRNPYGANLLPALTQFRVPIQYATYRLNGTVAASLDYPALSFLLLVPFTLLTHGVQSVIIENTLALVVEMVLVFVFVPRRYRALAVVLALGLSFLFDYTIGGDIITLAMPFLLVVAYRWSDIGRGGRLGRGGAGRAVCLGLAASICQFPWFVAPFLLIGLLRLRVPELGRRRGTAVVARFVAVAGGVFVVVNAPFVVWGARVWLAGIFAPLFQKAIPFGQGLVDATAFFHVGGGNLDFYTAASLCVLAALIVAYAQYFGTFARATFILPSVIFLFSTRSLSEYFIMMVATWLVSVVSAGDALGSHLASGWDRPAAGVPTLHRRARLASVIVLPVVALAFVGLALGTAAPLQIRVQSMQSNGQFRSIWRMTVRVVNRSDHTLAPHFATDASGYMTTFWNIVSGPRSLPSHATGHYVLVAPNTGSMPGVTEPFVLQAVTASPDTMSSSRLITPERFTTVISPSYVDRLVALGGSVRLRVQLRSPYGAPVHERGVPIALGQIVYAQDDLVAGEARINGAPEGQSPVVARTSAAGVASFTVSDDVVEGGNPLYFQAYVEPANSFPYGYSEVVSVQWEPRSRSAGGGSG
ncbi:MAG TPA: hypothetical protein VMD28_06705 [Acidimicrobiales bacterium]|nr:hypothetical protein [Acidimicrobiales bacterium]